MQHLSLILILLFCSGYQVQFHQVESKTLDGLALIDDNAYDPRLPSSSLVSKNKAQLSTKAKSFWLDFENGKLPVNIVIGQKLLQGALKDDVEYTVTTVPYTVFMVSFHMKIFMCKDMQNNFFSSLECRRRMKVSCCLLPAIYLPYSKLVSPPHSSPKLGFL